MSFEAPARSDLYVLFSRDPGVIETQAVRLAATGFQVHGPGRDHYLIAERAWNPSPASYQSIGSGHFVFAEGSASVAGTSVPRSHLECVAAGCRDPNSLAPAVEGDVTFVHVDTARRRMTAVRSCGGLASLYVWRQSGSVMVASRCTDLAAIGGWDQGPDALCLAVAATSGYVFPDHRTHLKDILLVGAGEACSIDASGDPRWYQYWDPLPPDPIPRPTRARRRERQSEFREALFTTLSRNLDPDNLNMLSLSGGVDSGALAALIRGVLGYPLGSWSQIPTPAAQHFARQIHYLDQIQGRYELCPTIRESPTQEARLDSFGDFTATLALPPTPGLGAIGVHPSLLGRTFPVIGGEGADEVVGSYELTATDWSRATPWWRCLIPGTAPSVLRALRWKRLLQRKDQLGQTAVPLISKLPSIFSPVIREEYLEFRASLQNMVRSAPGDNRLMWLLIRHFDFQSSSWEFASRRGIRHLFPFRTRRVLEIALSTHPSERMARTPKQLLRGALRRDVLPSILHRKDKGQFGEPDPGATDIVALLSELDKNSAFRRIFVPEMGEKVSSGDAFHVYYVLSACQRNLKFRQQAGLHH